MELEEEVERENLSPEVLMERSVEKGIQEALALINERFGRQQEGDNRLAFHDGEHTQGVIDRTVLIAGVLIETGDITTREAVLVKLAAAFHDTVQDYEIEEDAKNAGALKRKRKLGFNEEASADEAEAFMKKENLNSPHGPIYSDEDMAAVREAIMITVPGWDANIGTIVQPNMDAGSSKMASILALADINGAGIEGQRVSVIDNDKLFLEENIDIAGALAQGAVSGESALPYSQRILSSTRSQIGFVRGRAILIDRELAVFSEQGQQQLKERVFTKFDEAIEEVELVYAERTQMPPREVVDQLAKAA